MNEGWLNRSHPYLQTGYGEQDDLRHMDFVLMQFIAIGNKLSLKLKPYEEVHNRLIKSLNAMIPALTHLQQAARIQDEPISMFSLFRDALRSALRIAQHSESSNMSLEGSLTMPELISKVTEASLNLSKAVDDYPIQQELHDFIQEFLPKYLL